MEVSRESETQKMFASVWVKVEMVDVEDEEEPPDCKDRLDCEDMVFEEASKKPKSRKKKITSRKLIKCDQCEYTTVYRNCFQVHMMGHCNVKPYSCDLCGYTTRYSNSLQRHILIQHDFKKNAEQTKDIRMYKCTDCDYTSLLKWNLNAHRRKHKKDKQYKCSHCDYKTAYRHNYLKHGKVHNKKEVLFKCDKCSFTTKFEGHITRHLAQIHKDVIDKASKCDYCDFATKVRWRLNVHLKKSFRKDTLKCVHCTFETNYSCESRKHKVTHYNEIYGSYKPINVGDIQQPEKTDDEVFNVPMFGEDVDTEPVEMQTRHEKSNNYTLDPKREVEWKNIKVLDSFNKHYPFKCVLCTYVSKYKASVQRHYQRQHTGNQNRPYKCVNCDFSTKTKDQIALHNKRSLSSVVMQCKSCVYTTMFKCQYIMHQKSHHKFRCTICVYSCKNKYEFQRHYASTHIGTGLKCQYCEYTATRKESLLCHETIHTGDKPFKCPHCTYMSVRKSLLDVHTKKYHSDIPRDVTVVTASKLESLIVPNCEVHSSNMDILEFSTLITEDNQGNTNY